MKIFLNHIIIVLLLFCGQTICGQTEVESNSLRSYKDQKINSRTFDKGHWEEIVGGIDYSEIQKKKKEAKSKKKRDRSSSSSSTSSPSDPWFNFDGKIWAFLGKLVLIILAVILLAVLVMHLFGNNIFDGPKNTRILTKDGKIDIENIEENMHEIELNDPIQLAIQRGEYDTAIRLYYIAIIKELSVKKLIKWKKDKTNRDYYNELAGKPVQPSFSDMTNVYERIWYGSKSLQQRDFNTLESRFQQVISSIKQTVIPSNG